MIQTSSYQIEVTISSVNRISATEGYVMGWKVNKQRGDTMGSPFSVYFRKGEKVLVDGTNRPHPKLVLAAAQAAWGV